MSATHDTGWNDDFRFMGRAIEMAYQAKSRGDVPVGAVIVINQEVITCDGNYRHSQQDPLAHAETVVIRKAAQILGQWRLNSASLYVTVEPCVQCSGSIYLSRIGRVVFGCANPKGGALRFISQNIKTLGLNHSVEIQSGIRELECAQLLRSFFKERRLDHRKDLPIVSNP